jgi:hypothetical protein
MRLATVAVSALLALGCFQASGDDEDDAGEGSIARCRAICQASRSCPQADPNVDCTTHCYGLDRIIVAGACRTRFNALLDCDEALDDICTESVDCSEELTDYGSCIDAYCDEHVAECEDVFGRP